MVKNILLIVVGCCLSFLMTGGASELKKKRMVENLMATKSLIIETTLAPEETYVGQLSMYSIELITDSWFSGGVDVSELWISDAIVIQLGPPENNYKYIGGRQYSAFRIHFGIFPQGPGDVNIPSLHMKATTFPDGHQNPVNIEVDIPAKKLLAQLPETEHEVKSLVSTPELTLTEQFDRSLDEFKVGESLQRSVRIAGKNLVAMMLPPIQSEAIPGIGIYPDKPKLYNNFETEGVDSVRVDMITYIMEKAGSYQLPEIRIHWWDTENEELQEAVIAPIRFTVVENPNLSSLHAGTSPEEDSGLTEKQAKRERVLQSSSIGILMIILMFSGLVFLSPLRRIIHWRLILLAGNVRKEPADRTLIKQMRRACAVNDASAIVTLLMCWLNRNDSADRVSLLRDQISAIDNDELKKQVDLLMETRFGKTADKFESGPILFQHLHHSLKKRRIWGQSRRKGETRHERQWTLNP